MSINKTKPAKVIHMRIKNKGNISQAMEIVREFKDKICHAIDYKRSGKYVILMHERDEYCRFCKTVEDYTSYLID